MTARRSLTVAVERFPLTKPFSIARGTKHESVVVTATIEAPAARGRGECVPYARYGENVDSVTAAIQSVRDAVETGVDRVGLQALLPPGAARNALDCALWDFEAKRLGLRAQSLAGLHRLPPVTTAYTLSLGNPDAMAAAAGAAADRPLLKVKLGADGDAARIAAIRAAAPAATIIVDANEGWTPDNLKMHLDVCAQHGVALVEQPLPAAHDGALAGLPRPVPICADESVHTREGLPALRDRYDLINVKLDKTGGLTEALALVDAALGLGFGIFVGCMVGTSLAMAPALLLTPKARFVDLDGPLLLAQDREPGLRYDGSVIQPPEPELWG